MKKTGAYITLTLFSCLMIGQTLLTLPPAKTPASKPAAKPIKKITPVKTEKKTTQVQQAKSNTTATSSFTDARDGKIYKIIKIGTQTWMAENLNVGSFRNEDAIPQAKTAEEWKVAGDAGKPAWCYYDNDPANGKIYGKLYNWYAVNDPRGLAPPGWHVAGNAEWNKLTDFLGGDTIAGNKMKAATGWEFSESITNTNSSGFTGLPGSFRYDGTFKGIGYYGYFWSSTEHYTYTAWFRYLDYGNSNANSFFYGKENGFSVRCVRD